MLSPFVVRFAVPRRSRGFTLLEMLAALTIFGLVAGILATGVVQAMRLGETGQRLAAQTQEMALPIAWFRETVALAVVDNALQEKTFVGTARGFVATTLRAQDNALAGIGRFGWSLAFDAATTTTELQYRTADGALRTVHRWQGSSGGFGYLDRLGRWHDVWPPVGVDPKTLKNAPLPALVALTMGANTAVLAAILDHSPPLPSLKELLQ